MRKGTILSVIALLVSIVGLLVALIAYFKRRSCALCDDLDDDLMEYYDDGCGCGEDSLEEAAPGRLPERPLLRSPPPRKPPPTRWRNNPEPSPFRAPGIPRGPLPPSFAKK